MAKGIQKKAALVGAVTLVASVIVVLVILAHRAYTGPVHCQTCHQGQTDKWLSSGVHAVETTCTDCHAVAHGLLPKRLNVLKECRDMLLPTNVNASDVQVSRNCMECHPDIFQEYGTASEIVSLSHRIHFEEDMTCLDCHRNISHDTLSGRTYRPPKKVCYECHMREIDVCSNRDRACLNCHRIILSRGESGFPGTIQ